MKPFLFTMALLVALASTGSWSSAAEIVLSSHYADMTQPFSEKDIATIEASRAVALEDMDKLAKVSTVLLHFKQNNDQAYGLPSDVDKLEQMMNATEAMLATEVKEAKSLKKSLLKKYKVKTMPELGALAGKIINPGGGIKPTSFLNETSFFDANLEWIENFAPQVRTALKEAEKQAKRDKDKLNKAKKITDFPGDSSGVDDLGEIKEQMLAALTRSILKNQNEVINISVTTGWKTSVYSDTKKPYRKIIGTVLFADSDSDGISRFTSYSFISNKIDGSWQPLKFRAFSPALEGWAKPVQGSLSSSGGKGLLGGVLWLLLSSSNILAGLLVGQNLIKSKIPVMAKVVAPLQPLALIIGLTALGTGLATFILSILRLDILAEIIPQATAVLLGFCLARDFIKGKATGKLKDQLSKHDSQLNKMENYSQIIGLAGLLAGLLYLFLAGSLYVI